MDDNLDSTFDRSFADVAVFLELGILSGRRYRICASDTGHLPVAGEAIKQFGPAVFC